MAVEVRMPKFGLTMEEGAVIAWLKPVGSAVVKGEPLLEIETDKAVMEVECTADGVLSRIFVEEGTTVAVGTVLAEISDPGDGEVTSASAPNGVEAESAQMAAGHGSGAGTGASLDTVAGVPVQEIARPSRIGRIMGEQMLRSVQEAPQFCVSVEIDMSAVLHARSRWTSTKPPSMTAYLVCAAARTLREFPLLNATMLSEDQIAVLADVNIGVATAVDGDLYVLVVRNADTKGVGQIGDELATMVSSARVSPPTLDDIEGGTFTVSNLGMFGIDSFMPIVNPPQSGILAAGACRDRAVAREGSVCIRPTMIVTLMADHRVVDGAYVSRFLGALKDRLENADFFE